MTRLAILAIVAVALLAIVRLRRDSCAWLPHLDADEVPWRDSYCDGLAA